MSNGRNYLSTEMCLCVCVRSHVCIGNVGDGVCDGNRIVVVVKCAMCLSRHFMEVFAAIRKCSSESVFNFVSFVSLYRTRHLFILYSIFIDVSANSKIKSKREQQIHTKADGNHTKVTVLGAWEVRRWRRRPKWTLSSVQIRSNIQPERSLCHSSLRQ